MYANDACKWLGIFVRTNDCAIHILGFHIQVSWVFCQLSMLHLMLPYDQDSHQSVIFYIFYLLAKYSGDDLILSWIRDSLFTSGPTAAIIPTASKPASNGSIFSATSGLPKYRPDVKLTSLAFTPAKSLRTRISPGFKFGIFSLTILVAALKSLDNL